MIRTGVLEAEQATASTDVCPACDGSGQIVLTRLFGRYVEAPYRRATCTACSGTGAVVAEAVVHCDDCDAPIWADQVCTHQIGNLCADHTPHCLECLGDRDDR